MEPVAKIWLSCSDRPLLADEYEFIAGGWLRARVSRVRYVEGEAGEIVAVRTEPRDLMWPPQQVRVVQVTGGDS